MPKILVYADSLSWGMVPGTRERWLGIFEAQLNKQKVKAMIIENCLNGGHALWEGPFKKGRKGIEGLSSVIEMHSPLDLVILMLGTNDFKSTHNNSSFNVSLGVGVLIREIQTVPLNLVWYIRKFLLFAHQKLLH